MRAPQRLVEPAQRRAAIARDEAGGIEARDRVARALQHQQADERLRSGEKHATAFDGVLVVEAEPREIGGGIHAAGSIMALNRIDL